MAGRMFFGFFADSVLKATLVAPCSSKVRPRLLPNRLASNDYPTALLLATSGPIALRCDRLFRYSNSYLDMMLLFGCL